METLTEVPNRAADVDAGDVALAASGDRRAFERLYRRHVARIHSLARRMAGDEIADDATQETFVRAWQKLATFRGESAFGTWLYRVGINVILAQRAGAARRRSREEEAPERLEQMPARPRGPELGLDLEAAIAELPEGARRVFVLHDVEGFKHEEIAGLLGVNAGTSKSQLHRARMILRERLRR